MEEKKEGNPCRVNTTLDEYVFWKFLRIFYKYFYKFSYEISHFLISVEEKVVRLREVRK